MIILNILLFLAVYFTVALVTKLLCDEIINNKLIQNIIGLCWPITFVPMLIIAVWKL